MSSKYSHQKEKSIIELSKQAPSPSLPCQGTDGDGAASLPCLYSNNSTECYNSNTNTTENEEQVLALAGLLTPYYKRAAQTLYLNVERLIQSAPSIGYIGFLTLTFPDNVTDSKEAYNRFRSFNTHYLSKSEHFGNWISTKERQSRGAWHYHILVELRQDIKTGINWEQLQKGNYISASDYLKSLWKELREVLPKYGLGRSELLPIRTTSEAMGRYIGKYISKHIGARKPEDKGVRLVTYSKGWVKNSAKFAWNTTNAKEWRRKVNLFAKTLGCTELYQLSEKLGSDWAYKYVSEIAGIDEAIEEQWIKEWGEEYYRDNEEYLKQIIHEQDFQFSTEFKSETVKRALFRQELKRREKQSYKDKGKFREYLPELKRRERLREMKREKEDTFYRIMVVEQWKVEIQKRNLPVPF